MCTETCMSDGATVASGSVVRRTQKGRAYCPAPSGKA